MIPVSLVTGGADRLGTTVPAGQPVTARLLRWTSQWRRGALSPFLPTPPLPSILLIFLLGVHPLRSGPTAGAGGRDFRLTQALLSRVPLSALEKPAGGVELEVPELLQRGVFGLCVMGTCTREKRLEVGSSRLEPPPVCPPKAAKILGRIHGAAGSMGLGEGKQNFSTAIKQILRNVKQLKSYKVCSLAVMELKYKSVKDNRGRLGGSVD